MATNLPLTRLWIASTIDSNNVIIAASEDNIDSCTTCFNANRMYMNFAMPTLPRNPRIKKAELQVFQSSSVSEYGTYPLFGLYQVNDEICTGTCTPIDDSNLIDYARMRMGHCEDGEVISYTFDITTLVDKINKNENYYPQLVLKLLDESITSQNNITLYGSSYGGDYAPKLVITYESSYGVNTSYRTHTHELGRFGQGSVDLQCGNLMFESEDFAWSGNRMPVTIKHLFNSALAGYTYTNNSAIKLATAVFSAMKLGYGFKLNIMQSMVASTFVHEGTSYSGYVYVGENGEETFFKKSETQVCCDSNSQCYNLFEDVNGGDMLYDPEKRTLKQGEDTYQFDASGRLIKISDATEKNHIVITYTSNRITSVTDGAGREFGFTYNTSGQLLSIVAPDLTAINYTYTGYLLTGISYPDGKKAVIAYSSSKPTSVTLQDANGAQVYKVAYTFSGNRLASVTEYGSDNSIGAKSDYSYSVASAKTLVTTTEHKDTDEGETANNVITTTYTFDDDGNIVSEYVYSTDTGKVGSDGEESGINPHSGNGGAGIVSNINNLLTGHNFESLSAWSEMPANCGDLYISGTVYFDDIQLVRNSLETYLSASDFVVESTGTSDDAAAEAIDTTPTFNEAKDNFGNALTETTFTDGDFGTIYRSFKFNDDDCYMAGDNSGNDLIEETDARGHKTTYTVDGDTSRNEEVTDRLGNKTAYEYDNSGRTTKVTSKDADGTELAHVSYAYDTFDNMTEIVRGDGMKYALAYNEFHNLESIGIEGKSEALIKYAYKNGNGRLKQMTYANGHTMKAVYNSIGQMVAEKWFETEAKAVSSTATPIAHYKYVYDGDGNIVRSIDISGKKEYNYEYEEGRIVRATEAE